MGSKAVSGLMLTVLLVGISSLVFNVQSVYAVPPVADFNWTPLIPLYSDTVMVISSSTPNGGEIVEYNWTLASLGGEASWISPNNVSTRTFHADWPGEISVTLNITDSEGTWDTETEIIIISLAHKPIADFTYTPEFPTQGDSVEFTFTGIPACAEIVGYNWTLASLGGSASWGSSNNASTRTLYAQGSGGISVTLNVTGIAHDREVWDAKTKNITILAPDPPPTVGGIHIPVNKLSLLAPCIGLNILLAVAAVTVVYIKRRKNQ